MSIMLDIRGAKARYQKHRDGHGEGNPAAGCETCRALWDAWMAAAAAWGREATDPARLADTYAWQAGRIAQDPREYVPAGRLRSPLL